MIVVIGGKTIKGNIQITVHSEEKDVPLAEGDNQTVSPIP